MFKCKEKKDGTVTLRYTTRNEKLSDKLYFNFYFFLGPDYFCQGADHCWDFELARQGALLDSKTAEPAIITGNYSFVASPTGNGLSLGDISHTWVQLGNFGSTCLVDPSTCHNGFTIAMFVKVMKRKDLYYFGNIRRDGTGARKIVKGVAFKTHFTSFNTVVEIRNGTHLCTFFAGFEEGIWFYYVLTWERTQGPWTRFLENEYEKGPIKCVPESVSATEPIYNLAADGIQNTQYDNIAIWFNQIHLLQAGNMLNYSHGKFLIKKKILLVKHADCKVLF